MDSSSENRHQKKHMVAPKSLLLYLSLFLFLFFSSSSRYSFTFHPSLQATTLPTLYTSAPHSTLHPPSSPIPLSLHHSILFPDHVLLTLSTPNLVLLPPHQLHCLYHNRSASPQPLHIRSVLSTDRYDQHRSIVRCPLLGSNFSVVGLRHRDDTHHRDSRFPVKHATKNWDKLVYEATLDGDTAVLFVKGLNLRPHVVSDPTRFRCHFGPQNGAFWLTTKVVSVAQEVVRCSLPRSIQKNPDMAHGISITLSHVSDHVRQGLMPSVARIGSRGKINREKKSELCACTMVWNQARALREWVMYHAWLGVERWFIYDNNSDDEIDNVARELELKGYNISRVIWPWIKSQEAGFSHCALRAKGECEWVGFFDVDEFFYFHNMQPNSLRSIVANFSSSKSVAEIRTGCQNFGPSGLSTHPKRGVTVGYTCRLMKQERHKSIVRPDSLHESLLNVVHHFELRKGFRSRNMPQSIGVINHYKYQVWETFKAKFFRRVATYVVDWQEDQNIGSKDRAPGLGTQAIEPSDWRFKFCQVWDTALKNFLLFNFTDPQTGLLPWETS